MSNPIYSRTELLVGAEALNRLSSKRVILFGVGGVGSWCAECLVRSGITDLTLVDCDRVSVSNINRQLIATTQTVGRVKVEVMRERLLAINPEAHITALQRVYSAQTADSFHLEEYDYVIDAIDSLQNKADLILHATGLDRKLYSSMGAALKMDPKHIHTAEFWQVSGCPLGAALRRRFRRQQVFPKHKFLCVYSDELLTNKGAGELSVHAEQSPEGISKGQPNGTMMHITAMFGLTLASMVIEDALREPTA